MNKSIRVPAEWELQKCIWTCWPSAHDLWEDNIDGARAEIGAMIKSIIAPSNKKSTPVKLLVATQEAYQNASACLPKDVELFLVPFGDIWLRDTGPIFVKTKDDELALCFGFNGWGGKYSLEYDDEVNGKLAESANCKAEKIDFILEGGSIDGNGKGVFLTTKQCLLNKNRNPDLSQDDIEKILFNELGAKQILWLEDGLLNDHTDGHIDNIARFIGENKIICQAPFGNDDPNAIILEKIYQDLLSLRDLQGNAFEIIRAPSPGLVENDEGEIVPASHMNFIITNGAVIMPHYGTKSADLALKVLAQHFPQHEIIGIKANFTLTGGGSFHCITQQQPL